MNENIIKESLKKIKEYIRVVELSSSDLLEAQKVIFKLSNIEAITENIDEDFYLNSISTKLNNLENYCNSFISGNHNQLNNINILCNEIINILIYFVDFNLVLGNKSEIKNNIKNYKSELTRQKNVIDNEIEDFIKNVNEKHKQLEENDSNINTLVNDFNNKLNDLDKSYEKIQENINNLISNSNEKVEKMMEAEKSKLDNNYIEQEKEFSNDFNSLKTEFENKLQSITKEFSDKYNDLYEQTIEKDSKISKLLDIVGEKARIGEYKKYADSSKKERIFWQILTVFLFLVAFGIMCFVTLCTNNYDKQIIFKYVVSAILMGGATYAGKQASNLRKDEVYYRKQELELASIDVYLESMSTGNQEMIKTELSNKLFGQAQKTYTNKYDEKKEISIDDVIRFIEAVKK